MDSNDGDGDNDDDDDDDSDDDFWGAGDQWVRAQIWSTETLVWAPTSCLMLRYVNHKKGLNKR